MGVPFALMRLRWCVPHSARKMTCRGYRSGPTNRLNARSCWAKFKILCRVFVVRVMVLNLRHSWRWMDAVRDDSQ